MDYNGSDMYKTDEELKEEAKERKYGVVLMVRKVIIILLVLAAIVIGVYNMILNK